MPNNTQQVVNPPMGFGRWILFGLIVVLPGVLVCIGSVIAMPDGWWMYVGLVGIMIGVGAVFTYYSDSATKKIKRYCVVAHFVCMLVLAGNLGVHIAVVREVSAAKKVMERKDKVHERKVEDLGKLGDLQVKINQSAKELKDAEAKADRQEAIRVDSYRRAGYTAPPKPKTNEPMKTSEQQINLGQLASDIVEPEQPELDENGKPVKPLTLEGVYEKWRTILMIYAFIDAFTGIFFGGLLMARWEWDRNHDGIADNLQQPQPSF